MQYDIIIVGGGIVGATLASALQKNAIKVALIDESPIPNNRVDERLIALNHGSFCLFKNIGLWSSLSPFAEPIKTIHISHRGHFGIAKIDANNIDLDVLGYVVPAHHINQALYTFLSTTNTIDLYPSSKVTSLIQEDDRVILDVTAPDGPIKMCAKYVVGSDGSYSTVRQLLKVPTEITDYHQSALVTVTQLSRDHQNIAYERFLEAGAIAMLPLINQQAATIWTGSNELINELMQLSSEVFLSRLQMQFGYRLGRLQKIGKRALYPLKKIVVKQLIHHNVILLGNAAHTLHPIAAQGLNLALYEVACLADCLEKSGLAGMMATLSKYLSGYNFKQELSHRLAALFSKQNVLMGMARQLGMISFDVLPLFKQTFAKKTAGTHDNLPRLMIRNVE